VSTPPIVLPIVIEHLSFRYADSERWILRDVSFGVAAGETVLLLGPSGSGKSTLVLCLNGLIPHLIEGELTGEVRIGAQATIEQSVAALCRQVGEVFQDPETQMVMPRVEEEVAFGLENLGLPQADMPERITSALAQVRLQDRPRAWVDSLSGGQKQRLALASILALRPSILVLDEPTANLDPMATVSFFETLARLKKDTGMTIVLIEHRLDAVLPLVDRIVAMSRNGEVIAQGKPQEVFTSWGEALQAEGIWRPMTCRLTQALAERSHALAGCPLTMDEVEASLRHLLLTRAGKARGGKTTDGVPSPPAGTPPPPGEAAIEMRSLTFTYPDGPPAVDNVSLRVDKGRFFALVGANGSGKTTLAKQAVGLLRPTCGSVSIFGKDARRQSKSELARQVGYVFQNPEHQFVTERVVDELAYSLHDRWPEAELIRRVSELLLAFGLAGYEDANPFALSQGQKRRLSVATMVALGQPVLILDEPSFGQDQLSTQALMSTLETLHNAGTTLVFITHDMQLVAEYADEVAVMSSGRVIFQGPPRGLFLQPAILSQASLTLPPLVELSHRLGIPPLLTIDEWVAWAEAVAG
jgi:energy-coupling factor transport system ATP-binding protein